MPPFELTPGLRPIGVSRDAANPRMLNVALTAIPGDDDIRYIHTYLVTLPAWAEAEFEEDKLRVVDVSTREQIATSLNVFGGSALMAGDHAAWAIVMRAAREIRDIQPGDSERVRQRVQDAMRPTKATGDDA